MPILLIPSSHLERITRFDETRINELISITFITIISFLTLNLILACHDIFMKLTLWRILPDGGNVVAMAATYDTTSREAIAEIAAWRRSTNPMASGRSRSRQRHRRSPNVGEATAASTSGNSTMTSNYRSTNGVAKAMKNRWSTGPSYFQLIKNWSS